MRRMLFGLAVGLLTFASSARAEGPIVRWDPVLGNAGFPTGAGTSGPVVAGSWPGFWYTVRDGRVMLNLETGEIWIRIRGLSRALHMPYTNALLGTNNTDGAGRGVVVCNSSERYGPPTMVPTQEFVTDDGGVSYQ